MGITVHPDGMAFRNDALELVGQNSICLAVDEECGRNSMFFKDIENFSRTWGRPIVKREKN